ncbi:arsenate reductase/protein-tyrosine-phosphatase family protein [Mycobacterium sp. HUMS_1102779]|uniref:arsenate reductase/protein-tyrosine-phosphatase family protein n=1 Tax=Mycobacterium sp. HUMS_1102779 TaxID=3383487 RepID=UPI00389B27E1
MTKPLHVAFICRYNRGRSPMAAAMFTEQLRQRGLADAVRVSSAGTCPLVGARMDAPAARLLVQRDYPVPDHRAAAIGAQVLGADVVVALGREHVGQLQAHGVADDRLHYVQVPNPCVAADYDVAFDRISAALPSLHRLVDEHLARTHSVEGWRFWIVRPGEDLLRNPVASGSWSTAFEQAVCRRDAAHQPPAARCVCGVYADRSWAAVSARAGAFRRQTAAWASILGVAAQPAYVTGRVCLNGAVPYSDPLLPKFDDLGVEWRAASGEILELYIVAAGCDQRVGDLLVNRYGVPVWIQG